MNCTELTKLEMISGLTGWEKPECHVWAEPFHDGYAVSSGDFYNSLNCNMYYPCVVREIDGFVAWVDGWDWFDRYLKAC